MVLQRDADDPARRWGFVFAIARTWKTVEDKAIKDLVKHGPRGRRPEGRLDALLRVPVA